MRGLEDQINNSEFKKTTGGATLEDFKSMVSAIYENSISSKEKPLVCVMGGFTFKNDGEQLYIAGEKDTWLPCTIDLDTKKISLL